jgi:GxxExxY protein
MAAMTFDPLLERATTKVIIESFYEVYITLGFGFREHRYSLALERELVDRGLTVQREVVVPIWYKGQVISTQRLDMVVADRVLVENKSSYVLPADAEEQLGNYLKATSLEVGLLLYFGPKPSFARRVDSKKDRLRQTRENSH